MRVTGAGDPTVPVSETVKGKLPQRKIVRTAAAELLGEESVIQENTPQLTVEDFAYFAAARPACFWHLGCTAPEDDSLQVLHNSGFHPDDACIPIGIAVQVQFALKLMEQ